MGPNRSHPDFPEYKKRWDNLWREMNIAEEAAEIEETKNQSKICKDGLVDTIRKKYMAKIAALQQEFKHLYD